MKKQLTCLAGAALLSSGALSAGDWGSLGKGIAPLAAPDCHTCLSYDYVDLHYISNDFGTPYFQNGDGWGLGFSKSLGCHLFVTGSFADSSYDYNWVDHFVPVETRQYRLGLGSRVSIGECFNLVFQGGVQHVDAEYSDPYSTKDYDSWGYYVGPGIRARVGRFEFFANLLYFGREGDASQDYLRDHTTVRTRVDDYGWLFTPVVIFHLNDVMAFKGAVEVDDFDTSYLLGARFHY